MKMLFPSSEQKIKVRSNPKYCMDLAKTPWIYIPEDSNHNTHCQKNADQHQSRFPNFASYTMLRNGKYKQLY